MGLAENKKPPLTNVRDGVNRGTTLINNITNH